MGTVSTAALALGLLLIAGAGSAMAQTPASRPAANPGATISPDSLPGVRRAQLKPDTPAERAEFLRQREASERSLHVDAVTPLPAQIVNPTTAPARQ